MHIRELPPVLFATFLAWAANAFAAQPEITPAVREQFAAVAAHSAVKQALAFIRDDDAKTLAEQKAIVAIAAPPFKEQVRAQDFAKRLTALGFKDAGTDSNIAISLGIPAMTVGRGGVNGDNHSVNEWWDPKDAYLGPQKNLLIVLGLVGIEGVSKPILAKRAPGK